MEQTYLNPVYKHSCPDPFVLKHLGEYWCYFTGKQPDGRAFGILHSNDLVQWEYIGGALDQLPGDHPCYWAPEVTYQDGIFYLYYSVGNEDQMQIRVATAPQPQGPFTDRGHRLTSEPFAIDAHVFIDDDGAWYLFYAVDFLEVERVGTGTVMDRMLDPFTLAGKPRPVTRAKYDWQIYDPQRVEKGGVCWHTVEGPFVLKHDGRYYQMFSGGNWKNASYGIAYGVSDRLDPPGEWFQPCDAMAIHPIMSSVPERGVIGPGHNSVVRGPDNRQLFCIYHRWQPETEERVLAIDPLGWEGDRLVVYGPSTTPQPAPPPPLVSGFDRFQPMAGHWDSSGGEAELISTGEQAEAALDGLPPGFLMEVSLQFAGLSADGEIGIVIRGSQGEILRLSLAQATRQVHLKAEKTFRTALHSGFALQSYHLLRLEQTASGARLSIDGPPLIWDLPPLGNASQICFFARGATAGLAGFALSL